MIVRNKKVMMSFFLVMLGMANALAHQPELPRPQMGTKGTPPPGLPIDDHLIILFAVALVFGVYISMKLALKSAKN